MTLIFPLYKNTANKTSRGAAEKDTFSFLVMTDMQQL